MTYDEKILRYNKVNEELRSIMDAAFKEGRKHATAAERAQGQPLIEELEELEPDIRGGIALEKGRENKNFFGGSAAISRPIPGGSYSGNTSTTGSFRNLGEFAKAAIMASIQGGYYDPRLAVRAISGLGESIASDGGFMVQPTLSADILTNIWSQPILQKLTKIQVGPNANGVRIPGLDETSRAAGSRWGGLLSYYLGEADAITPSKPKFRQIELSLKKLAVLTYLTEELMQDVPALGDFLRTTVTAEFDYAIQEALLRWSGAGQPLGILNSGALVTISKESGQLAASVVWENIVKMHARLLMVNKNSSAWLINKDVLPSLLQMSMSVGTGGVPVWIAGNSAANEPGVTLLGLPVIQCESCSTLGTVGDILLCDLSQMVCIEKGNIKEDISIHVRFTQDENCLRWIYRYDMQPAAAAPIAPAQGASNTISSFVALATRS